MSTGSGVSKSTGGAHEVFRSGTFRGVPKSDAFAAAAVQQEPVVVKLGKIPWPQGLAPAQVSLGDYKPGTKITQAVQAKVDALMVLFTEYETSALLDVFTGTNGWSEERAKTWCGYAHNFENFAPDIEHIGDDAALKQGMFGYLSAVKIGNKTVALFKSELHPKQNGPKLPFIGVMQQLIAELSPSLVIGTGTAGAIGSQIMCGDVAITDRARFHVQNQYPSFAGLDNSAQLSNAVSINTEYVKYAASKLTTLSLDGLSKCHAKLEKLSGYSFVQKNTKAPAIYVTDQNPAPGPQPMNIVSADYLTVDDTLNSEGLQKLGVMNDTDDAFLFYAINKTKNKPKWLSIRNASEPQIADSSPPGGSPSQIVDALKNKAGSIYGIYQYCTTLNSAFACWGVIAGM